jgi:TolB-like protein
MKKLLCFLLISSCVFLPAGLLAQQKPDIITMLNGEKKTGKIALIGETTVRFSYQGETAQYELKKSEISKIEFGSGRVETFNAAPTSSSPAAPATTAPATTAPAPKPQGTVSPEQRRNKIAVLPFEIETNDPTLATPSMSKQVQQSCISALRGQSPFQTIQDPMVTNNILAKNNLTTADLAQKTPEEWAALLGVEYVIMGTYQIQNKGTSTHGSGFGTIDTKKKDDKTKGTVYGSNNSYTTTSYDTRVRLSIYNDHGEQLFSDSRAPAFGGIDSYNSALKNLMKKSPFKRN